MAVAYTNRTAYLQIQSGKNIGRIVPLNQPIVQLGRAGKDCAMIARRFDGYYIAYLEGKKVTLNNQTMGTDSILLKNGDLIHVGAIQCQFYL